MPKILYIVSSWPNARGFGGQLRAFHVGKALQRLGDVAVLYVGSEARDTESERVAAASFRLLAPIEPRVLRNAGPIHRFRWAFDVKYLNVHGYIATEEDQARVASLTRDFDVTWILNSRTPSILQRWSWPKSHLDIDDIPSTYLWSVAQNGSNIGQRLKASLQWPLLARRERSLLHRFCSLSVCSSADRHYLGDSDKIHVIPNGFEQPSGPPDRTLATNPPRIGFIGLFSYAPNVEGIRWFVSHCWPQIRASVPGIRLRLIGKGTDGPVKPTGDDIDGMGWVADPAAEMSTWSAMIVPIRFGGGTRIKLAEAFSRKVPAVSTTLGAFGYEVAHERQLMIADRAGDFSAACIRLVREPNLGAAIAERAWGDYLSKWTWDAIYPKVGGAINACLGHSSGHERVRK